LARASALLLMRASYLIARTLQFKRRGGSLNRRGVRTARGRTWTHVQILMLLRRFYVPEFAVAELQKPLASGGGQEATMHSIIYLIGLIVIMFSLSLIGLR
jgi:hypothetical protein